jgi:hypothetical protein
MPFPNFYPPLFYWCVALLTSTQLVTTATAMKLMVMLPVILMPAALWMLGYVTSDRSRLVATATALATVAVMADARFFAAFPAGLDYFSTFQIGLYTQPLGFVLMVGWFICYLSAHRSRWRFVLATLLLALTVLANFFNAVTASLFVCAVLILGWCNLRRASEQTERKEGKRALIAHIASPLLAACLTLFWTVPMLASYSYFVTRPTILPRALSSPLRFSPGTSLPLPVRSYHGCDLLRECARILRPARLWQYSSSSLRLSRPIGSRSSPPASLQRSTSCSLCRSDILSPPPSVSWRECSGSHRPSPGARNQAGALHHRHLCRCVAVGDIYLTGGAPSTCLLP